MALLDDFVRDAVLADVQPAPRNDDQGAALLPPSSAPASRADVAARHLHFLSAVFPVVAVFHIVSQLPPRLSFGTELLRGALFCARAVAAVAAAPPSCRTAACAGVGDVDVRAFAAGLVVRTCALAAATTFALGCVVVPHRDVARLLAHVHTVPPVLGLRTLRTRLLAAGNVVRSAAARAASRSRGSPRRVSAAFMRSAETTDD